MLTAARHVRPGETGNDLLSFKQEYYICPAPYCQELKKRKSSLFPPLEPPQIVRTAQKTPPKQGYEILSNILAPKFHRCQFCFSLNPLMVVEVNILINEPPCFRKSLYLNSVYALRFEDREKIFS